MSQALKGEHASLRILNLLFRKAETELGLFGQWNGFPFKTTQGEEGDETVVSTTSYHQGECQNAILLPWPACGRQHSPHDP